MVKKNRAPPPKGLWAYAYDITFAEPEDRLQPLRALLDREYTEARGGARTWAGRVVVEPQVTRILVVSDSPAQDQEVNRRLEAEMRRIGATFEITLPLAVTAAQVSRATNGLTSDESS